MSSFSDMVTVLDELGGLLLEFDFVEIELKVSLRSLRGEESGGQLGW